jgi:spoIIIJ-associated protein
MSNGDQGETVTVKDWPADESVPSPVEDAAAGPSEAPPSQAPVATSSVTESAETETGTPETGTSEPVAAHSAAEAIRSTATGSDPEPIAADVFDGPDVVDGDAAEASDDLGTMDGLVGEAGILDRAGTEDRAGEPVSESPVAAQETDAPALSGAASSAAPPKISRGSVRDLEEEGEVAADYLEELLDIVDVDGDIDIDVENGRASLAIVAEGGSDRSLRRLVGANGEVLEALQELTRLAVQASTGERSRLMLDVAGHRAHRRKVLTDRATQACAEVKSSGKPSSLEPMSAFERKIVHDVVAAAGLESESEGVDPHRHVVVLPAAS